MSSVTIERRKIRAWGLRPQQAGKPSAPELSPIGSGFDETQPVDETQQTPIHADEDERSYIGAPLPRVEQMPEGIVVEERSVGRAYAQWIVQIRCECGRRWFEVEAVSTATCPRCGMALVVDVEGGPGTT